MILDKYVTIMTNGKTTPYYTKLGYKIEKMGVPLQIKLEDLSKGSSVKVHVKCDFCGIEKESAYNNYIKITNNCTEPYYCKDCAKIKREKTMIQKYGASNATMNPEINAKKNNTLLELYGSKCALSNPVIRQKADKTLLKKYNETNVAMIPEVQNKKMQTNIKRYGCKYTISNAEIREKGKETIKNRYGVEYAMQNESIKAKSMKNRAKTNNIKTSKQQIYLHKLYGGLDNYACGYYSLDIYLPEYQLDIEYNGGGHNLCVKCGNVTDKDFQIKEIIRGKYIHSNGINQMFIISKNDYLPSDEILFQMFHKAIEFLSVTDHHWIEFDIDSQVMRNATGCFLYNYGKLRKIKSNDIQSKKFVI